MLINSRHNEKIKFVASLKQKKFRDETGLYLAEGVKMVREAFAFSKRVRQVVCTSKYVSEFSVYGVPVTEVTEDVLKFVSDAVTPQGVVAVIEKDVSENRPLKGVSVCLDGVSDAGNLGTVLRISASAGVKDVYLIDCVDAYSPKVVRSSMSGLYLVNVHVLGFEEFERISSNVAVIVADMKGESVFDFSPPDEFCLLLGSEAHGVSEKARALAKKTVRIPMLNGMESLNVGVSAGIILYQLLKNTLN